MFARASPPANSTGCATTSSPITVRFRRRSNYRGFPKSICTSINHVVCHGIPGERRLIEGDILNIDVTPILDGWHGDTSRMFFVGERMPIKARRLVDVTYEAMMRGIAVVRPGLRIGAIGDAIQRYAESHRFSVVRDFCGHGVGRVFHDAPSILHYGHPDDGPVMREGMIFTVEPMINVGRWEVKILSDGWTAVTKDRSLSAQFEHTVGVTATGYEIFTISPAGLHRPPYPLGSHAASPGRCGDRGRTSPGVDATRRDDRAGR